MRQRHSRHARRGVDEDPHADTVVLPELWLAPGDDMKGRYPELLEWIRRRHRGGSTIYSACSGAVLLAATGLLNGREATSHWGYQDLFSAAASPTSGSVPSRTSCSPIGPAGS